ncbi:MAG TPA: alpha-amylase family glycosyl hydrolase [Saprospiraceae bacterium]|nr:alpha-amylase family glycosyl hydrolase [Saprospiraceae bacterium]HNT19285.1 alpha-amylase family glycosyl hydrolase [Saprospiraceae bacterium]
MSFSPIPWIFNSNIYEVNLRQYTTSGSLRAFTGHLRRLRDMGIEILWFMPLTPISIKARKGTLGSYYAASDFATINPEFGSEQDFRELVDQAHRLGLKVIIDWVANHTGWDHTWTRSHPEFYLKNDAGQFFEKNGWEDVIDLDYNSKAMRQAMTEAMAGWVRRFNIDGFRCDMAMLVPLDFWVETRNALDRIKPLVWLAECEDPAYYAAFDTMYGWEWMHATSAVYRGQHDKFHLEHILFKYRDRMPRGRRICLFTSNHDENSWNGTEFERYGDSALLFAALNIILPLSIPLIYSGQELPLRHRLKFFDKDEIPWSGSPDLADFYDGLLEIRKTNPLYGLPEVALSLNKLCDDPRILSLQAGIPGQRDVAGIFNLSPMEVSSQLNGYHLPGVYKNILTRESFNPASNHPFKLSPWEFRLFENTSV